MPEEVISIKNNYIVAIAACEIIKYFTKIIGFLSENCRILMDSLVT